MGPLSPKASLGVRLHTNFKSILFSIIAEKRQSCTFQPWFISEIMLFPLNMDAHKHYCGFYVWSHLSKYTHGNYHQHIIVWLSFKILVPSDSLSFTFQSTVLLSYPPHRVHQPPPPPVSGLSGGIILPLHRTDPSLFLLSVKFNPPPLAAQNFSIIWSIW